MELYITADGSPTLINTDGVAYHSRLGAEAESRYVYLQASQLAARLAATTAPVRVLEVGLGTGLNFVLVAEAAAAAPQAQVHYTSFEPQPVPLALLAAYYVHLPHLQGPATQALLTGQGSGQLGNLSWDFVLQPWPQPLPPASQDVIFYDAFGPKDAPALWTPQVLTHTLACLRPGGVLVTFSINGATKRLLRTLGYAFERPKGFGPKREMLVVHGHQG